MTRDIIPEEREEKITRIVQKATRTISPFHQRTHTEDTDSQDPKWFQIARTNGHRERVQRSTQVWNRLGYCSYFFLLEVAERHGIDGVHAPRRNWTWAPVVRRMGWFVIVIENFEDLRRLRLEVFSRLAGPNRRPNKFIPQVRFLANLNTKEEGVFFTRSLSWRYGPSWHVPQDARTAVAHCSKSAMRYEHSHSRRHSKCYVYRRRQVGILASGWQNGKRQWHCINSGERLLFRHVATV